MVKLCALVAACSAGLFSFDLVMALMFLIPAALAFAPRHVSRWIRRRQARTPAERALVPRPGWRLPVVLALAVSWTAGYSLHVHVAEQKLIPLIAAVERYHKEHGEYPRTIEQIGLQPFAGFHDLREIGDRIIGFRDRSLLGARGISYGVSRGDRFTVGFVTMGFNTHDYDSRTKRWRNWD